MFVPGWWPGPAFKLQKIVFLKSIAKNSNHREDIAEKADGCKDEIVSRFRCDS